MEALNKSIPRGEIASGAKAPAILQPCVARLKPCPFKTLKQCSFNTSMEAELSRGFI
jgi:hypothetical protein